MDNLTYANRLSAPKEVKKVIDNKINNIVKEMLQKHIGGKEFFDNLDLAVRDKDIVQSLFDEIEKFTGFYQHLYIVSGEFGRFFANWVECFGADIDIVYQVNGGLREGNPIQSLEPFKEDINGQDFIIVDDSFYSGKTVETIREHVISLGGSYAGTFVIYDGSHEKRKDIHSLYRYHESEQSNN